MMYWLGIFFQVPLPNAYLRARSLPLFAHATAEYAYAAVLRYANGADVLLGALYQTLFLIVFHIVVEHSAQAHPHPFSNSAGTASVFGGTAPPFAAGAPIHGGSSDLPCDALSEL